MQPFIREISNGISGLEEDTLGKLTQQLRPKGSVGVLWMKHKEKRIQGRENHLGKVPEGERSMSVKEEEECVAGEV